jgi:aryl-alcohol dehydrogenase-like predicted oxidoreductase
MIAMQTRKIAEIDVSTICLGTMTFGSPVAAEDAVRIVHWALDNGINFIDTADMYEGYSRFLGSAGGVAEQILGSALKDRREQAVVTTKAGNPVGEPDPNISRQHLTQQLDRSLKYLQTDYVDLFELHRPDGKTPFEESVAAMADFVKSGKIRHWGFSNFDTSQIRELIRICDDGGYPRPVVSQPPYSWLKRDIEADHIPTCREFGIAITPYQPLQGGLLTGKYKRGQSLPQDSRAGDGVWLEAPDDEMFERLERFEAEAAEAGLTASHYAVKWVLDQPGLTACVVGVKRIEQLQDLAASLA